MALSDAQFGTIYRKLSDDGGFTVNPHTGEAITSGISVAPRGNESKVPIDQSTAAGLKSYHTANSPRFARGAALGGWRSEHDDFLDTPTVYPNTNAGESRARQQMVLSGQEASFDLDNFQEKFNPFHPEGRRKSGMESHEIADIAGRGRDGAEFAAAQPEVQNWINAPAGAGRVRRWGAGSS